MLFASLLPYFFPASQQVDLMTGAKAPVLNYHLFDKFHPSIPHSQFLLHTQDQVIFFYLHQ